MSTATLAPPLPRARAVTAPSLGRLTMVELRKMTDTRAGFWLQLTVAGLTIALVALVCIFGDAPDRTFASLLEAAVQPASILLPIIGILLVSSEWSQRTAAITTTATVSSAVLASSQNPARVSVILRSSTSVSRPRPGRSSAPRACVGAGRTAVLMTWPPRTRRAACRAPRWSGRRTAARGPRCPRAPGD